MFTKDVHSEYNICTSLAHPKEKKKCHFDNKVTKSSPPDLLAEGGNCDY